MCCNASPSVLATRQGPGEEGPQRGDATPHCLISTRRTVRPSHLTSVIFRLGGTVPGMAFWRKGLFAAMHLNANLPATYFGVPAAQVVEVGMEVEI